MEPFPEEHDLIALFECEPVLTDKGVPWCYNCLTFKTDRGDGQIMCEIEPGDRTLRFEWIQKGQHLVSLDLNWVAGITAELDGKTEALVATFRDENLVPLRIQLKSYVSVFWGTKC